MRPNILSVSGTRCRPREPSIPRPPEGLQLGKERVLDGAHGEGALSLICERLEALSLHAVRVVCCCGNCCPLTDVFNQPEERRASNLCRRDCKGFWPQRPATLGQFIAPSAAVCLVQEPAGLGERQPALESFGALALRMDIDTSW